MGAVCAAPLLARFGGRAAAAPIAKHCGPKDKYVIGFSQANYAEPYRQHVNNDLIALVKAIPQFELQIADGAGNDNTQTSQVDNFVTQGVDLLMISPFEAAPLTPAVARADEGRHSGDRTRSPDQWHARQGLHRLRRRRQLQDRLRGRRPIPPRPCCRTAATSRSSKACRVRRRRSQRLNGFKDGVKQNPKIKVVAEQAADWVPDKAQTAFSAMLQANPDIKVVYASNDMMAAGSYLAAKGAGKEGKIGIIGTDGLPGPAGGVRAVASGQWAATFTYPTGAAESLDLAKKILIDCAESVPDTVTVPTLAITKDNAADLDKKLKF